MEIFAVVVAPKHLVQWSKEGQVPTSEARVVGLTGRIGAEEANFPPLGMTNSQDGFRVDQLFWLEEVHSWKSNIHVSTARVIPGSELFRAKKLLADYRQQKVFFAEQGGVHWERLAVVVLALSYTPKGGRVCQQELYQSNGVFDGSAAFEVRPTRLLNWSLLLKGPKHLGAAISWGNPRTPTQLVGETHFFISKSFCFGQLYIAILVNLQQLLPVAPGLPPVLLGFSEALRILHAGMGLEGFAGAVEDERP